MSCNIRSASVDLPWSMWAMMQKFLIRDGSVNVVSAKLGTRILCWRLQEISGPIVPRPAVDEFRGLLSKLDSHGW
ncbi:hypothetical protein A2J03_09290 [Rhodococcus sp. EPR-157]|nr:hypothetical protein A2J03_09290 [Rhodococcus sp. EPR-157]